MHENALMDADDHGATALLNRWTARHKMDPRRGPAAADGFLSMKDAR